MVLSRVFSGTSSSLDGVLVEIEVDTRQTDKPFYVVVGLPDTAIREAKDRVVTALKNSYVDLSCISFTVNLAPADLKKEGSVFDLPIAIGLLRSLGVIKTDRHHEYLIVGELGLGGVLRFVPGALCLALLAKALGKKGIVIPSHSCQEASLVPGIEIIPIKNLKEAILFFNNEAEIPPFQRIEPVETEISSYIDFHEIHGQFFAKRALEIAAAGGHNILFSGPPGVGKSMLAKAIVGILPDMTFEERLEVANIHSLAGLLQNTPQLKKTRPFRAPHQTISYAGLVGGGTHPRPGEIVLANRGVLFLDELPEFSRISLESLRQPLEDKTITISRAQASYTYPANFIFIAAMNPCPCGYLGHPEKPCRDTKLQIERYIRKISGPLLDRIDLHIQLAPVEIQDIHKTTNQECSEEVRKRVEKARDKQYERFNKIQVNAEMSVKDIEHFFPINTSCKKILNEAVSTLGLSMRAYFRLLRTAVTIHDLGGASTLEEEHILEALSYRQV